MGFVSWFSNLYNRIKARPLDDAVIAKEFPGVESAISRVMKDGIELWYAIYTNNPPWCEEDRRLKPTGTAGQIGKELARNTLSEFNMTVTGGPRADYLDGVIQNNVANYPKYLEIGECLGGVALRPYVERGKLHIDANGPTAFTPTDFDGDGRAIGGVFKETETVDKHIYTRLEYHGFEYDENGNSVYVIRNKAYKGEAGNGNAVELNAVPKWAELEEEIRIENLEMPLFAYFKNPSSNDIDLDSQVGVSVFGALPTIELLRQADEQWERIKWEYRSGERKIFTDATSVSAGQFNDRLFEKGRFTAEGDLFEPFSPEFRNDPLYEGFQYILKRIEYNTGLAYGMLSDPPSTERTATEILASKHRAYVTIKAIQGAFENALNNLVYALDVYATLYNLAPAGEYEVSYNWGDGVLDDPDTMRQDMAMDIQRVNAGLMSPVAFIVKWDKVDEDEAKRRLAEIGIDALVDEEQEEIGGV